MRGGDEYEGVVIPLSMERLKDAMRGDRLASGPSQAAVAGKTVGAPGRRWRRSGMMDRMVEAIFSSPRADKLVLKVMVVWLVVLVVVQAKQCLGGM